MITQLPISDGETCFVGGGSRNGSFSKTRETGIDNHHVEMEEES